VKRPEVDFPSRSPVCFVRNGRRGGGGHFSSGGSGSSHSSGSHSSFGGSPSAANHGGSFLAHHAGVSSFAHQHSGVAAHHYRGYPWYGYGTGPGGWSVSLYFNVPAATPAIPFGSLSLGEYDANFAERGEWAFGEGDHHGAVFFWRHALVDDPQNPLLLMLYGQSLFATGAFDEAAGVTQAAMNMLPKEQWSVVVAHYRELYADPVDYTLQLRALEHSLIEKPDSPARHFLAGFHYGFLGFRYEAIGELNKVLTLEPHDEMARQLRDELQSRLPK
jgi:tetratricopeptide (TPR) repeat protein